MSKVRLPKCLFCGSKDLKYVGTGKKEYTWGPYDQIGITEVHIYKCKKCMEITVI